ncbi:molybdopterin-containing oxidoreductase family protein [Reyranella soli]|nr:molybdopterin-dependent oxidoreductase [Reyranella soli]
MTDHASTQKIHGHCALCIARCGTIATVEGGRFTRLDPDPSHPTGQAICAKGRAAPELVYHPDRLTRPLRRTRPKGDSDPGWVPISWDEALDLTATAMQRIKAQYGARAVAFSMASASTTAIGDSAVFVQRLRNAFGTPNLYGSIDVCGWGRAFATQYTFGVGIVAIGGGQGAMADIANAGCLILWGYNPSFSRLTHATAIADALQRGMKLIVIDPRKVGLGAKADVWLRVRPGSDGALALGLANLMIRNGWYDRKFIQAWSNGPLLVRNDTGRLLSAHDLGQDSGDEGARRYFAWHETEARLVAYDAAAGHHEADASSLALEGEYRIATPQGEVICRPAFELYAALCRTYPPEAVEATCWIPPDQLEAAARLIWHARPVSYYAWSGHEQHANTTQTARAMSLLYALTGSFDGPGGNVLLPGVPTRPIVGNDLPGAKGMAPALGMSDRPLGLARWNFVGGRELYEAMLESKPYPVRGLIGFGANMLMSQADGIYGRKALASLDFYAHLDMFMTPTAALADVVLPVASAFEREALRVGFEISAEAQSLVQLRPAVVPPPGQARPDASIIFDLAGRLGFAAEFWNGDIDAAYRQQLEPSGVTLEQLRAHPEGVRVPLKTQHAKHAQADAAGFTRGFATPSRRVELYSETLLEHGYAPLPDFVDPTGAPGSLRDPKARFPLLLTCAKPTLFLQSQNRALASLRKRSMFPEVEMHPEAARERQISQGDWVSITTADGSVRACARFNETLDPRVVVGQHGWWQGCAELDAPGYDPFGPMGANYNLLIDPTVADPVSRTASYRANMCEIRAAGVS